MTEIGTFKPAIGEILAYKEAQVGELKKAHSVASLRKMIAEADFAEAGFADSLDSADGISVIAEIKYASPSTGALRDREGESIAERVGFYEEGGASAISVLTDERFFGGGIDLLKRVKEKTRLPVLRKDFIIDESQIYQSKAYGADAVLLIAALLDSPELERLCGLARELKIQCLVEIHSEEDLMKLPEEARVIGINNRNLKDPDYGTDIETTLRLAPMISGGRLVISESGIGPSNVHRLRGCNVRGVLVGAELMKVAPRESAGIIRKIKNIYSGQVQSSTFEP